MKLNVAGKDRSEDLGREIAAAAIELAHQKEAPYISAAEDQGALWLRSAGTEAVFLDRLARLMWDRTGTGTLDFYIPRRPGVFGNSVALLKRLLWRVLRYQQDRMVFQQNIINAQLTVALELVRTEYTMKTAALEQRIRDLENKAEEEANHGRKVPLGPRPSAGLH